MPSDGAGPLGRENTGVIVVDHGSRRADANRFLERVATAFADESAWPIVEPAHMELAEPTISAAFERCVSRGAEHVIICPFFLLPGRHVTEDIPALAASAAAGHPEVGYTIAAPIGAHAKIADVIASTVFDALQGPDA